MAVGEAFESIIVGFKLVGEVGSKVTSSPAWSIAVHWLNDGHATATRTSFVP
jgi:hypothetical protein